ncbi:EF-hand calcium-binding domain-containing protein 1 isoform X2 [Numida meleagris]|uniref:EF-hand calcium-binding domain-containing protein 1 isoform X2 n=1 Tax=Numida meleagris TaxID=8996 RepID=UPI000B3DAF40|nr:EF-hand calcium-binding domain-containing protein 1 isoform X2 [Numida meleagris]
MRRRARRLLRPGCPGSGEEAAAMSKKRLQQLVESLSRSAKHFNRGEVECLIRLFDKLVSASHSRFAAVGFDRNMFRDTLHRAFGMTDDVVMDRGEVGGLGRAMGFVCNAWAVLNNDLYNSSLEDFPVFRTFDKDNDNCISVVEWVEGLSVFLRGTLEERIKYCFEVYDLNGDGYISREEMFQMLKNSLLKQPSEEDPDEGIKDLVDIALKKMDYDHDGKLSFADFEEAVKTENLLLEAFGPCLPDIKVSLVAVDQ